MKNIGLLIAFLSLVVLWVKIKQRRIKKHESTKGKTIGYNADCIGHFNYCYANISSE